MSERYIVTFFGDAINCVKDTTTDNEYNLHEIIEVLNQLNNKYETTKKALNLAEYQLKVQDRILNEYEGQE